MKTYTNWLRVIFTTFLYLNSYFFYVRDNLVHIAQFFHHASSANKQQLTTFFYSARCVVPSLHISFLHRSHVSYSIAPAIRLLNTLF